MTSTRDDTTPDEPRPARRPSLGGALHLQRPRPVTAIWDEHDGWSVGLHHDPGPRRYPHPDLLPTAPTVAGFVVDLALGRLHGADQPITTPAESGRARLRIVRRSPQ